MPLTNLTKGLTVDSEGGSATTNLAQGLCKVWITIPSGQGSITDSLNVSSLDDDATGNCGANFTNNMGNANYAPVSGVRSDIGSFINQMGFDAQNTSSLEITHVVQSDNNDSAGGLATDGVNKFAQVTGDLA
tara:strand:+ start:48 stop:443 length:396 start_codon:yes stop_codon:yes gene_type:complete